MEEQSKLDKYLTVDPDICHGKVCFKGTRIMVSSVIELLEAGESFKQITEAYPGLTDNHIRAALHLASQMLENNQYIPFRAA